ncbi:P-selectin glycoprotein ligand 1 [Neopsephotus bourkii]|uniref:P-selectin glycoprotein ligand 1 n=1 Tax=Neopsephotus bourkii TaxID=309878 RepID=UPI002AA51176|nr:P-selectin glycoprotein ligand 1 [Neopsephotus bourkii]
MARSLWPRSRVTSSPRRALKPQQLFRAASPSLPFPSLHRQRCPRCPSALGIAQPGAGPAPVLVIPTGATAPGPTAAPGRGPMAPGWAVLVLLVLSTLRVCGAAPQHQGVQWVWGVRDEAPLLTRGKRDDVGKQLSAPAPGHGHGATAMPSSNETDSLEPNPFMGSEPAPAAPGTSASLHRALVMPTTADPLDETDSPEPDSLQSSAPPPAAPSTNASLHQAPAVPTTADPLDDTDNPKPDPLLSSAPPAAPSTSAGLHWALVVPTTANPLDETETPEPNTLPPAEPGTQAAPKQGITTIPIHLVSPSEEGTVPIGTNSSSSMGPRSATPPALGATTTGYKGAGARPVPTHRGSQPWGTAEPVPWDPSGVMGKCLLSILLLALVAATFMACTAVLGALLWRRTRTARRRLSRTEMLCIPSLMPDGDGATNGPRPALVRPPRMLLDGGPEADGDNLTLSSFLPEHA